MSFEDRYHARMGGDARFKSDAEKRADQERNEAALAKIKEREAEREELQSHKAAERRGGGVAMGSEALCRWLQTRHPYFSRPDLVDSDYWPRTHPWWLGRQIWFTYCPVRYHGGVIPQHKTWPWPEMVMSTVRCATWRPK